MKAYTFFILLIFTCKGLCDIEIGGWLVKG